MMFLRDSPAYEFADRFVAGVIILTLTSYFKDKAILKNLMAIVTSSISNVSYSL